MSLGQIRRKAATDRQLYQTLSGAGAIDITHPTTRYTSTGATQALTIVDGKQKGFRKLIIHAVDGGSGVITAGTTIHLADSIATIVLTNVRDWVELEWNGTAWAVVAYGGTTFT